MRLHCIISVWGDWHITAMEEVLFPSLLASGNLPATLRSHTVQVSIMTRGADVERIYALSSYQRIAALVPSEVVAKTDADDVDAPHHHHWWHSAIAAAKAEGASVVVLHPDSLWANGALCHVCDALEKGKKAVLMPPNIRVVSLPKTDGLRNNLYERIFVTASPDYAETLPTIANPPSIRQYGDQYVWTVTAPESWKEDHERSAQIRSYGLDKIMQHSHEVTWRDEGDCNTEKLHASPQKGGDAMLKWYIKSQNAMGWLQGVYSNYTDFCTLNTNWSPDFVQRKTDGEWRRAWPRNYALKPSKAVEFDAYYAKRIKEKFGVKMSYTDVHTAVAPWDYCDFDARVPGAGTFAATFYAYGQLLRNDQKVYGPTESEGTYEWLYAGLDSGNYGWVYTDVNLLTAPLDVSFRLRKIHPLECDYGMGDTNFYLSRIDKHWAQSPRRDQYVDLFLATTIAYGNMGWLVKAVNPAESFGVEAMARSYYMMQQLQQQYAFSPPRLIQYAGRDGKWYNPSQAIATGANSESRLHVVYANGTEVYVNRSTEGTWTVAAAGRQVTLPVSGWVVFNPSNHFYESSAIENNHRIDYVDASGYEFLDGRGQWAEHGNLGAAGGVVLRRKPGGLLDLIDIHGNNRIAFRAPAHGTLSAYGPDGKSLGEVKLSSPRAGWEEFEPVAGGRSYIFAPAS